MASLLLTGLAWIAFIVPQVTYDLLVKAPGFGMKVDEDWVTAANITKQVVPKTGDIILIAGNLIGTDKLYDPENVAINADALPAPSQPSMLTPDARLIAAGERRVRHINPWFSIGTSLAFEALILLIAVRRFSRAEF